MSYVRDKMRGISNIIYNGSQEGVTKDQILDSLINQVKSYNVIAPDHEKVDVIDFRKK